MKLTGTPASPGAAVGQALVFEPVYPAPRAREIPPEQVEAELRRYEQVCEQAAAELARLHIQVAQTDEAQAAIFTAQADILEDVAMIAEIRESIKTQRWSCDWSVHIVYSQYAQILETLEDPIIRQRGADIRDVAARLLRLYHGADAVSLARLASPCVVVAKELLPSDTVGLNADMVLAIATEGGGENSHAAILARSYGIPALVGVQGLLEYVQDGQTITVDAESGAVDTSPSIQDIALYEEIRAEWQRERAMMAEFLHRPGQLADGTPIEIGLNLEGTATKELEAAAYTEFCGLFRTEFLYLNRVDLPGEQEQYESYRRVLAAWQGRPVTLRTLDIGGDKALPGLMAAQEPNPFLGLRGLRLCLANPQLFQPQLRAALRAAAEGELWLLLPMVTSIQDIRDARAGLDLAREALNQADIPFGQVRLGAMVEVPSIALQADRLAAEVDFASIGTNDLCQYLMAADRMNPAVAGYYQSLHPALLRLIYGVATAFARAGKPVSLCGEMAGDARLAPLLAGLGLTKLSMGAASIAAVKRALAACGQERANALAKAAMMLDTQTEVEELLQQFSPG